MSDLVLILRYRKAVTYGFHALLGALETHETATRYEVQFAESAQATIEGHPGRVGEDARAVVVLLARLKLVDAGGAVEGVPGLAYRNNDHLVS